MIFIKINQEVSGLSQSGGGQEEIRHRFAHEREIRPAKFCPHYSFGKKYNSSSTKYCNILRFIIINKSHLNVLSIFPETNTKHHNIASS